MVKSYDVMFRHYKQGVITVDALDREEAEAKALKEATQIVTTNNPAELWEVFGGSSKVEVLDVALIYDD